MYMKINSDDLEERVSRLVDEISDIRSNAVEYVKEIELDKSGGTDSWGYGPLGDELPIILSEYEIWYNTAYPLVSEYLPNRIDEFEGRYIHARKGMELDLEYIDARDISSRSVLGDNVSRAIAFQKHLVSSIPARAEIEKYKVSRSISSEITSEEVKRAKELFDDEDVRAAGVICGVAIERHLITLCEASEEEIEFDYLDGISSLSHTLNAAEIISDDRLRLLQYISGIRNKCSHASDEEPEKREVERMLQEADDIIRAE